MTHELILITLICCFFVNSGAAVTLKIVVWRIWRKGEPYQERFTLKPFDCELCLSWWSCIGYLLVMGELTLITIAMSAMCAWCTPIVVDVMRLVNGFPNWVISKLDDMMR